MNRMQSKMPEPLETYTIPGRTELLYAADIDVQLQEIMHPYLNTHVVQFIVTHKPTGIMAECSRSTNAKKNRHDAIVRLTNNLSAYYEGQEKAAQIRERLNYPTNFSFNSSNHLKAKSR
jgi:hypothetical protein